MPDSALQPLFISENTNCKTYLIFWKKPAESFGLLNYYLSLCARPSLLPSPKILPLCKSHVLAISSDYQWFHRNSISWWKNSHFSEGTNIQELSLFFKRHQSAERRVVHSLNWTLNHTLITAVVAFLRFPATALLSLFYSTFNMLHIHIMFLFSLIVLMAMKYKHYQHQCHLFSYYQPLMQE